MGQSGHSGSTYSLSLHWSNCLLHYITCYINCNKYKASENIFSFIYMHVWERELALYIQNHISDMMQVQYDWGSFHVEWAHNVYYVYHPRSWVGFGVFDSLPLASGCGVPLCHDNIFASQPTSHISSYVQHRHRGRLRQACNRTSSGSMCKAILVSSCSSATENNFC
jgi:hypothetical protein